MRVRIVWQPHQSTEPSLCLCFGNRNGQRIEDRLSSSRQSRSINWHFLANLDITCAKPGRSPARAALPNLAGKLGASSADVECSPFTHFPQLFGTQTSALCHAVSLTALLRCPSRWPQRMECKGSPNVFSSGSSPDDCNDLLCQHPHRTLYHAPYHAFSYTIPPPCFFSTKISPFSETC